MGTWPAGVAWVWRGGWASPFGLGNLRRWLLRVVAFASKTCSYDSVADRDADVSDAASGDPESAGSVGTAEGGSDSGDGGGDGSVEAAGAVVRASALSRLLGLFFHPAVDDGASDAGYDFRETIAMLTSLLLERYSDDTALRAELQRRVDEVADTIKPPAPVDDGGFQVPRPVALHFLVVVRTVLVRGCRAARGRS